MTAVVGHRDPAEDFQAVGEVAAGLAADLVVGGTAHAAVHRIATEFGLIASDAVGDVLDSPVAAVRQRMILAAPDKWGQPPGQPSGCRGRRSAGRTAAPEDRLGPEREGPAVACGEASNDRD